MAFSKLKLGLPNVSSSDPTLASTNPEDVDEVDGEGQNILMGIISQLRPGCDLSRITLPTFILERKSMLERITNQLQQPNFLLEAHNSRDDDVKRFLLVVKWYMSCWHICPKAVKKPLNPILGEYFTCYWELEDGSKAFYVSEQTSHHPPKSSYFYIIPEHGIRVDGIVAPKSRFLGNSTAALMEGVTKLTFLDILDKNGEPEIYTLTQPNMYGRGILFGKMKFELGDHMIIKCPATKMEADIEFKTKGFIYGGYNHILGDIKKNGESLYELSGKWTEVMELKDVVTNKKSVFFDCTKDANPLPPLVRPLEEQGEFESRKLWKKVTDALLVRNHTAATEEKFKIEDAQRERAKIREQENVDFHPKLFRPLTVKESTAPGSDKLEFVIYKDHVLNRHRNDPQALLEDILTIAPIVPGQNFTPEFEIPAHEKIKP
ncbi:BA75_04217T0 [Komagataella pastoris]|uniref:BA75_04217T0 n=1 Tax=Komagataella pastoris TaxID=4922 RepID=A0A1B2JEI6_PICPA|nr:BA75_04217T0 [Komagataella pastoris]